MKYMTGQSCSEVYDIIYKMNLYNRIPENFIELIKANRDVQYKVNIDYSKNINEQKLQKGTRVLLALIYRDFLCSSEKKQELIKKDKEELSKIENELKEKYNPDNLFAKKEINERAECKEMIKYNEESFLKRILKKIMKFFKNNSKAD